MLGLRQFGSPQFSIPSIPADERAIHKIKDMMSFLNSIQWKADDEAPKEPGDDATDYNLNDNRTSFDWTAGGLDPSLGDPSTRIGETKFDNYDMSDLRELGNQSLLHGGALNFSEPDLDWKYNPMEGYFPMSSVQTPTVDYDRSPKRKGGE